MPALKHFGAGLFRSTIASDKAVALLHGYEYNGRILKVHHDRFTQQLSTSPPFAVTMPPPTYLGGGAYGMIQQHSMSYVGAGSGAGAFHSQPTSPFDPYPPQLARHLTEQYLSGGGGGGGGGLGRVPGGSWMMRESTGGMAQRQQQQPPPTSSSPKTPQTSTTTTTTSPKSPTRGAGPGSISIPPPPSAFPPPHTASMFSPRGLPPMTPSMPGFHFHPQQHASTPPAGMIPQHFLSPGGPASPHLMHMGMGMGMMGGVHVMNTPLGMLTPGPRLDATPGGGGGGGGGQVVWVPMTPDQLVMAAAGPFLSPPIGGGGGGGGGGGEYFPQVMEPTDYFPPVVAVPTKHATPSSSAGSGSGSGSGSDGAATTIIAPSSGGDTQPPPQPRLPSDPIIQSKVAGLSLDDESAKKSLVDEIALASAGAGTGAPRKSNLWMSQKARFGGGGGVPSMTVPPSDNTTMAPADNTTMAPANDLGKIRTPGGGGGWDLASFEMKGLVPSPGLARRASWGAVEGASRGRMGAEGEGGGEKASR